jgi:hypothetical protein
VRTIPLNLSSATKILSVKREGSHSLQEKAYPGGDTKERETSITELQGILRVKHVQRSFRNLIRIGTIILEVLDQ